MDKSQRRKRQQCLREKERKTRKTQVGLADKARQEVASRIGNSREMRDEHCNQRAPFTPHPSHVAYYCGGYVACSTCAAMATQSAKAAKLLTECQGIGDKLRISNGAKQRLQRLLQGELPRPEREKRWPNGEATPTPRRLPSTSLSAVFETGSVEYTRSASSR